MPTVKRDIVSFICNLQLLHAHEHNIEQKAIDEASMRVYPFLIVNNALRTGGGEVEMLTIPS